MEVVGNSEKAQRRINLKNEVVFWSEKALFRIVNNRANIILRVVCNQN